MKLSGIPMYTKKVMLQHVLSDYYVVFTTCHHPFDNYKRSSMIPWLGDLIVMALQSSFFFVFSLLLVCSASHFIAHTSRVMLVDLLYGQHLKPFRYKMHTPHSYVLCQLLIVPSPGYMALQEQQSLLVL